jgi:ElaB/YqjD/DUF883 family membrane-anchored ribosome-binding protein
MSDTTSVSPAGNETPADQRPQPDQSDSAAAVQGTADGEALLHTAVTGLQEVLVAEMSGLVGRLITSTVTEADSAVKRARAEAQKTLEELRIELEDRTRELEGRTRELDGRTLELEGRTRELGELTREKDVLAQTVADAKAEIAKLRLDIEAERGRAGTEIAKVRLEIDAEREQTEAVIQELDPYPNLKGNVPASRVVEEMREAITVEFVANDTFTIEFVHKDPRLAAAVPNRLAALLTGDWTAASFGTSVTWMRPGRPDGAPTPTSWSGNSASAEQRTEEPRVGGSTSPLMVRSRPPELPLLSGIPRHSLFPRQSQAGQGGRDKMAAQSCQPRE